MGALSVGVPITRAVVRVLLPQSCLTTSPNVRNMA